MPMSLKAYSGDAPSRSMHTRCAVPELSWEPSKGSQKSSGGSPRLTNDSEAVETPATASCTPSDSPAVHSSATYPAESVEQPTEWPQVKTRFWPADATRRGHVWTMKPACSLYCNTGSTGGEGQVVLDQRHSLQPLDGNVGQYSGQVFGTSACASQGENTVCGSSVGCAQQWRRKPEAIATATARPMNLNIANIQTRVAYMAQARPPQPELPP
mmetsp:Transcript_93744/g.264675  ORF Transcript_93744/g.264675 Transcript_93744/m.264675 type:complete len:213 (+) Transcript_93744:130-768(+)